MAKLEEFSEYLDLKAKLKEIYANASGVERLEEKKLKVLAGKSKIEEENDFVETVTNAVNKKEKKGKLVFTKDNESNLEKYKVAM